MRKVDAKKILKFPEQIEGELFNIALEEDEQNDC